jgi:hypothetical protein
LVANHVVLKQTGHESVAAEVLQLLGQIADQLSVENVAHLIACFERMPKHDYTAELLQFLSEMSKKSTQSAQRLAFLTQLRAVVCDEQASNDISRTAVHLLTTSTHGETFRPHRYVHRVVSVFAGTKRTLHADASGC